MMLEEISRVLEATKQDSRRADYASAIIDGARSIAMTEATMPEWV